MAKTIHVRQGRSADGGPEQKEVGYGGYYFCHWQISNIKISPVNQSIRRGENGYFGYKK